MRRFMKLGLAVAIATCLFSSAAIADVTWGSVSHTTTAQSGEQAVLLTAGTSGTFRGGSTFTIQGTTSTGALVDISTNNAGSSGVDQLFANTSVQLLSNAPGSADTSIDQLTFTMPGHIFTDISMNLFGVFDDTNSVSFLVTTNDGTFMQVFTGLTDDNTDNWILLTATNGEYFTSISLDDTRFFALQNLNVSGVGPLTSAVTTPEPASVLLLSTGLAALASFVRRRSSTRGGTVAVESIAAR